MIDPIVFKTDEDACTDFPSKLKERITEHLQIKSKLLLEYPTVYIHFWDDKPKTYIDKKGQEHEIPSYKIYVGESNDVVGRTRQHYADGEDQNKWQYLMTHSNHIRQMVVIGHEHFNKSFTLDVENRLIEYIMSVNSGSLVNGRGNPQNSYYPEEEFEPVFHDIWKRLVKLNPILFRPETEIEHSAIFKASPLKKLKPAQIEAKEHILSKICEACEKNLDGQLIFVQGEAGTGKTVLNSALFYDLITRGEEICGRPLDCHLMVNHDQQLGVYKQLVKRLNLQTGDNEIVHKPTSFINKYSPSNKVDVSFIDEGHLLLTQGKMSYQGKNQLDDIICRSKVTVVMFDEFQVLTAEEYWEPSMLDGFKDMSKRQCNYIEMKDQLRMNCSESTLKWLDDFILKQNLTDFIPDSKYEVKSFDSPEQFQAAIVAKSQQEEHSLSRIVASYDWEYQSAKHPGGKVWGVRIGDWFLPWNYETSGSLSRAEKRQNSNLAWAEQPHTINEVGSTFTIQGFDLSYVGVILGPSVKYRDGKIIFDPSKSWNQKAIQNRTLENGKRQSFGDTFIRNEVKVLMTRGVHGLYIYACDPSLRSALSKILPK